MLENVYDKLLAFSQSFTKTHKYYTALTSLNHILRAPTSVLLDRLEKLYNKFVHVLKGPCHHALAIDVVSTETSLVLPFVCSRKISMTCLLTLLII